MGIQVKRSSRKLVIVLGVALAVYVPVNLLYILSTSLSWEKPHSDVNVRVEVASVQSQADGTINLVINLNPQELMNVAKGVPKTTAPPPRPFSGNETTNAIPRHVNITLLDQDICKRNPNLHWIMYVHSSPKNRNKRDMLRQMWGSKSLFKDRRTDIVFLMGKPVGANAQKDIEEEFALYKDIVQGDFLDDYKNLTLKAIMGLKWVHTYCKQAPYALKMDDDSFINIFSLMHLMEDYKDKKRLISCPLWKANSMPILRDPKKCMKWCVADSEFPGRRYFPKYCAGIAFLMSRDIIPELLEASKSTPFFWIDDVYVTGLLTAKVPNIEYVDLLNNFVLKEDVTYAQYTNDKTAVTIYFSHIKKFEWYDKMWNATLRRVSSKVLGSIDESFLKKDPVLMDRLKASNTPTSPPAAR